MPDFDCVPEGKGATVTFSTSEEYHVGTYGCITCVGIYFKLDHTHCFIAHINGASKTTWPYNFLAHEGAEEIGYRVQERLIQHAERHQWNYNDEEFGKDLILVCPLLVDGNPTNSIFQRAGGVVVAAIRNFFVSCADVLSEAAESDQVPPVQSQHMVGRASELMNLAHNTEADVCSHGFIVSPRNGIVRRLGDWINHRTRPAEADLGTFRPQYGNLVDLGSWGFSIKVDDYLLFPGRVLSTKREWDWDEHKRHEETRVANGAVLTFTNANKRKRKLGQ